jgi:hypothetical protein
MCRPELPGAYRFNDSHPFLHSFNQHTGLWLDDERYVANILHALMDTVRQYFVRVYLRVANMLVTNEAAAKTDDRGFQGLWRFLYPS